MTHKNNSTSFFIREDISEEEKIERRRSLVATIIGTELPPFEAPFDVERVATHNCENLVGSVSIPVGMAGPVPVVVTHNKKKSIHEQVLLPLATTEGALVASINRGARVVAAAGGALASVTKIGMSRAPVFLCKDAAAATTFINWVKKNTSFFESAALATSSHLHYLNLTTYQEDNLVFLRVVFDTDEAMGMNMVSIALDYWWQNIVPKTITSETKMVALSGNVCGDKKPAELTRTLGRGYWVTASVQLSKKILEELLHVDAQTLHQTHFAKNIIGSKVAGIPAPNMHVANAVAAFFAATGQDLAHVVDVAGSASVDFKKKGNDVAVELSMPSIPVGTVGGGISLPAQSVWASHCIPTKITAVELAAFVAVAALCGEISGLAALATHTLASAHAKRSQSTSKKIDKERDVS